MDFFGPVLLQVRTWMKPMFNMKNAMSITSAITSLMNRSGLPKALRRTVQGWGLGALGIIIGAALVLSLLLRMRRDSFDVRPSWQGKRRWLAAIMALALGFLGIHRMYMRRYATGVVQLLGSLPFLAGALLLSSATMMDFIALTDTVVGGFILFAVGLVFVVWRLLDVFMILFGGLVPRRRVSLPQQERKTPQQEA